MAYTKYSLTPANNNATPPDGAPEGMLPSAVNDTMRDMMAQIRDVGDGIRNGTYTMTAPVITGGSITGVALSGNTFTNPVITGGSINNTPIGGTTVNSGAFTTLSASGVATFSAGTVSAPALTTTGDTNTGIFFPAADTIAFTEGGVESMRITSAGDVGIGTSSPSASRLHIAGYNGGTTYPIRMTSSNSGVEWAFETGGSATNSSFLAFRDMGNSAERMRIDSSGNVGIGTSSPSAKLDISGNYAKMFTSATNLNWELTDGTVKAIYGVDSTSSVAAFFGSQTNHPTVFRTNNTERMRIDSSGRVGINTSSPTSFLTINTGASAGIHIFRSDANANFDGIVFRNSANNTNQSKIGWNGNDLRFESTGNTLFETNGSERMRITSGGDLLVAASISENGNTRLSVRQSGAGSNGIWSHNTNTSDGASKFVATTAVTTASGTHFFYDAGYNWSTSFARAFAVRGDGVIFALNTTIQSLSDQRLKENIVDSTDGLSVITSLRPVRFDWKKETGILKTNQLGFIAQEVEQVFPDAVDTYDNSNDPQDPYKSVGSGALIPVLVKAIQEQQAMIEELKQEVAALKASH